MVSRHVLLLQDISTSEEHEAVGGLQLTARMLVVFGGRCHLD